MHEELVNRLGGLSMPTKSVVRLTDRPDMTVDVYRGRKTKTQQQQEFNERMRTKPIDVFKSLHSLFPSVFSNLVQKRQMF